ncbi:unnamed protein product [Camellia sinensis]
MDSFRLCLVEEFNERNRKGKENAIPLLDDAAASLHDSQSTLKRACRKYDITGWSCRNRNKDNLSLSNKFVQGVAQEQIREFSQPPISDSPHKQDLATT